MRFIYVIYIYIYLYIGTYERIFFFQKIFSQHSYKRISHTSIKVPLTVSLIIPTWYEGMFYTCVGRGDDTGGGGEWREGGGWRIYSFIKLVFQKYQKFLQNGLNGARTDEDVFLLLRLIPLINKSFLFYFSH